MPVKSVKRGPDPASPCRILKETADWLSKQEEPDLSGYTDPEIVYRAPEKQHAGLVVQSKDHQRVQALMDSYQERFLRDFTAVMPAKAESMPARGG